MGGGGGRRDPVSHRGGFFSVDGGGRTDSATQSRSSARYTPPNAPAPKNLINCNRFGRCRMYPFSARNGLCSGIVGDDGEPEDQGDGLLGRGREAAGVRISNR